MARTRGACLAALGVLLLLSTAAAATAEGRVVRLEGQIGPYWEQSDLHIGGGTFEGEVPLRANESHGLARLEIEDRSFGSSEGYVVRFCDEPCPLDHDGPHLARAVGFGPFELSFPLDELDTVYYRVSVDDGARLDAHVSGSLILYHDPPNTTAPSSSSSSVVQVPAAPVASLILLGGGLLGAVAVLPVVAPSLRRFLTFAPLAGLFTRRETLLDHPVRMRLHTMVRETPGIHLRELRRALAMPPGQVEHHLQKLVHGGYVVTHTVRGYTAHFVPGTVDRNLMAALARVKSDTARSLLSALQGGGCMTLGEAAQQVGVALSTASYHVGCLQRLGLVEVRANGHQRWRVTALGNSFLDLLHPGTGSGSRTGPGSV